MPVGILTDVIITLTGGIIGCLLGARLPEAWKKTLNDTLGIAAIVMGIVLIVRVENLSAVILSLLLGCAIGQLIGLEGKINRIATASAERLLGGKDKVDDAYLAQVSAALVLFCCGGTGWFGSLNEGLTGDGSILITKSFLDGVTACIFGAILGKIVPALCIPQLVIYMALFLLSSFIEPYMTDIMIADFSAIGGIVTLVAGLRLAGMKRDIKGLDLLPSLIIVFFISALWTRFMA